MGLITPTREQMVQWQEALHAFEHGFEYPLGTDQFRIDHGADYLAFFERLGKPVPILATSKKRLIGVFVAVQRQLADRAYWYLCDLKVARNHGHRFVAPRFLKAWAKRHLLPGQPVYGVSMNDSDGHNRLVRALRWWPTGGPVHEEALVLFSLSHEQWRAAESTVQAALGPISWFDPRGIKDIVLHSTGQPMPLLHAQHGPWAQGNGAEPTPGSTHMFCLPAVDALASELTEMQITASATATILHRDCEGIDWRHLLTSDI